MSIDTRPHVPFDHMILDERAPIQYTNILVIAFISGPPLNITIDMSVVHLGKVREIDMVCNDKNAVFQSSSTSPSFSPPPG